MITLLKRICTELAGCYSSISERALAMLLCEAVLNLKCGPGHHQLHLLLHLLRLPLFFCLGLQGLRSTSWRSTASCTMSWDTKPFTASYHSSTSSTMMST